MGFGFRVRVAGEDGVDDGLLPFSDGLREGRDFGDVVVVGAPDIEAGELVADGAGGRGDAGSGGAQGEEIAQV
jgi:hypothetical protein